MQHAGERSLDHVYAALADPTRRSIVALLARGEATVGSVAAKFPMSLNGVSKHVKVLERAGVIERTIDGREHRLRLAAAPLDAAARWLDHYRRFWETRFDALEAMLVAGSAPPNSAARRASRSQRKRRAR